LFLTPGRALAYATQHSPWITVERACKPNATYSYGQGACGAMLDSGGCGRAVPVSVALSEHGPAGVVQLCPGVHAVEGGTQEREEGRDGGVWSEGLGDSMRPRMAIKARTIRPGAAMDCSQLCETAAGRTRCRCYTIGVLGSVAWPSLRLDKCALYRVNQYHTIQNLSSTVLAHSGYFMFGFNRPIVLE
jgi:hypothetical protein